MLDIIEIRNVNREAVAILDTATSVIWHRVYYGVGDFEIYARATEQNIRLLIPGNYVTRPDDDEIGIIEAFSVTYNVNDGYMITATGRFAKSLLDRRVICNIAGTDFTKYNKAEILTGNVEAAARSLVSKNAINCVWDHNRDIPILELGPSAGLTPNILDAQGDQSQKQVTCDNLMTWTDALLQEYGLSAKVTLTETRKLAYTAFQGLNRSTNNTDGNDPVIFSVEFDNLVACEYNQNTKPEKTTAIIGGEGEGLDRRFTRENVSVQGMDLREIYVNASSQAKKQKASNLAETWPSGTFIGAYFYVGIRVYAEISYDETKEYTLAQLQEKFPTGVVSGMHFDVDGVVYAWAVVGGDNTYTLTPTGYKAMCDVDGTDADYIFTDAIYDEILRQQGRQQLADNVPTQAFDAEINTTTSQWRYKEDYFLGDIVTVQDNRIGVYGHFRITEVTEVNDENGYAVSVKLGE